MHDHPPPAEILDGYRLIRLLGRGGFGEVWLCRSEAMGDYRALKWIPSIRPELLEKEYQSLLHYRNAAARLRSPHLVAIEHVNRNEAGLYYVMPLADGLAEGEPADLAWQPLTLATLVDARFSAPAWFSSGEITAILMPVLHALQTLCDAGLVHRDVKPENILFFNGRPCLGDISLLGEDSESITRRGTPGYVTPSWYVGGHPDMYGTAATLFHLLTGNPPDKMGRAAFRWPPQGERSLAENERVEWKRLHNVIRRAADERIAERYPDFNAMAAALSQRQEGAPQNPRRRWIAALAVLGLAGSAAVMLTSRPRENGTLPPAPASSPQLSGAKPTATQPSPELTPDQKADYQAHAVLIQGYLEDGNYPNALATVESLLATYPQSRKQPAYSLARATALKGLGRIEEAKAELRKDVHLSPEISAMATRKDLWEDLGDLVGAESDLTRILDQFGPNTFPLFLRAEVRAQRGDFPGVQADRLAAVAAHPEELQQRQLVDTMWTPLAGKYPGYAAYLKTLPPGPEPTSATGADDAATTAHDDAWILEVFNSILSDIVSPGEEAGLSDKAMGARQMMAKLSREGFETADYTGPLRLLDESIYSIPSLANTPVLSLFRALLLQRLGRPQEVDQELVRVCHRQSDPRLIDARVCLLNALGKKREAEELLTRMLNATPDGGDKSPEQQLPLLMLRARMRAILGDFSGVRTDHQAALGLIPGESPPGAVADDSSAVDVRTRRRQLVGKAWDELQANYPGYGAYLKSLPEK
jgi:serine/threonine protein kinase